jgi:hypothetical protein
MLKKMNQIKTSVKNLLTKRPELRDDDNRLIANIYLEEAGGIVALQNMSALQFLGEFSKGTFSNTESIRRVRQKLQEDNPELRGNKYQNRKKLGEDISTEIKHL